MDPVPRGAREVGARAVPGHTSPVLPPTTDVLIVGAGLAGASTAYHLRRQGTTSCLVLEQRAAPGLESSGRNAAILRTGLDDEGLGDLARAGARALRALGVVRDTGGMLVGEGDAPLAERVPGMRGAGAWVPDDGVVDVATLLERYLGGITLRCGVTVDGWTWGRECASVETNAGTVKARVVVNAAGAWAGVLGDVPLTPHCPPRGRYACLWRRSQSALRVGSERKLVRAPLRRGMDVLPLRRNAALSGRRCAGPGRPRCSARALATDCAGGRPPRTSSAPGWVTALSPRTGCPSCVRTRENHASFTSQASAAMGSRSLRCSASAPRSAYKRHLKRDPLPAPAGPLAPRRRSRSRLR